MSTINTVIDKLRIALEVTDFSLIPGTQGLLREAVALLTDPTVLLLEWNEEDVQQVAREIIAFNSDFSTDDIVANPLSKDDVEFVIGMLDKYYDCNYGITWDSIRDGLNEVSLPKAEDCLVDIEPVCEWTREIGTVHHYYTNCNIEFRIPEESSITYFNFCPYCGKKIKEVDDVGDKEKE